MRVAVAWELARNLKVQVADSKEFWYEVSFSFFPSYSVHDPSQLGEADLMVEVSPAFKLILSNSVTQTIKISHCTDPYSHLVNCSGPGE